ncbi:hypothetical protein BDM02DRAFT_3193830 [Thelephora ganbajun]|uniref:Uncharacterized protein n=1 Tax=Thelephora ganbajun TaxID=370292 RepID=A0ACB6YY39_THEGA|nr:hypothetical protein BDM02DRAFT_3193830 [Thelephora ganbajun]
MDVLSRIYSDEQEGVVRAESEYVDDVDEPIRGRRPKTHLIYVDAALISVMNAEETRDRKTRVEWEEDTPTAMQEFPDRVESSKESDGTAVDEELGNIPHTPKDTEAAEKLFRTISNQDGTFPGCLKGKYGEDPSFKPIIENPDNFTNFEIKDGLFVSK